MTRIAKKVDILFKMTAGGEIAIDTSQLVPGDYVEVTEEFRIPFEDKDDDGCFYPYTFRYLSTSDNGLEHYYEVQDKRQHPD